MGTFGGMARNPEYEDMMLQAKAQLAALQTRLTDQAGEIADVRRDLMEQHEQMFRWQRRAMAAEAEVARLKAIIEEKD